MAFTLFRWTYISRQEKNDLSPAELELTHFHEKYHQLCWWRPTSKKEEREACHYSFKEMMKRGYSFEECLLAELSTRTYYKYGLRLPDFVKVMRK